MQISDEVRQEPARLLDTAADLQGQFWDACRDIEVELGVDIEELSISDLSHWNVDHLVAIAKDAAGNEDERQEAAGETTSSRAAIDQEPTGGLAVTFAK